MPFSDGYKVSGVFSGNFDGDRIKQRAFHDQGMLVVNVNDPNLTWDQRELLNQIGEKFYGKRRKKD